MVIETSVRHSASLIFDISSVIDVVSDQLTDTIGLFCPTLKALNVVVKEAIKA
jgi:hypothetical protein